LALIVVLGLAGCGFRTSGLSLGSGGLFGGG